MKKKNNNKTYGLGKERELKNILLTGSNITPSGKSKGLGLLIKTTPPNCVTRARGSFGAFDIQSFNFNKCDLISVKSVRADYWSPNTEIKKIGETTVPDYCNKYLVIWWARNQTRPDKYGWEVINVL